MPKEDEKASAKPVAKAEPKPKKEEKEESRDSLRADARRPEGDPDAILKIEVFKEGGSRATYIAHAVSCDGKKEVCLEKLLTKDLRAALAFFENQIDRV